jgi:hypothetical protein
MKGVSQRNWFIDRFKQFAVSGFPHGIEKIQKCQRVKLEKFTFPTGKDPRADSFTPIREPAAATCTSFFCSAKYFN